MPTYEITDPAGRVMRVDGETPPNPMQSKAIFERYDAKQAEDPFADERTFGGQAFETAKAIPRGFAGSFLTAAEGLAELADAGTNLIGLEDLIDSGEENELVRLARNGRAALQESMGADEAYRDTWMTKFGEGLGSFASFFTPAAALKVAGAAGKLASLGQMTATGALAVGSGAGDQAQRIQAARDQGIEISEGDEDLSIGLGGAIGWTEVLAPTRILSRLSKNIDPASKIKIRERIYGALGSGLVEGVQEAMAGIAQDATERGIYNENLPQSESLLDDFTVGGAVGTFADLALNGAAGRRRRMGSDAQTEVQANAKEALEIARDNLAQEVSVAQAAYEEDLAATEALGPMGLGVNVAEIDPPRPNQLLGAAGTSGAYLNVRDREGNEFQAEEKVSYKKSGIEERYVKRINDDGSFSKVVLSRNGVPVEGVSSEVVLPAPQNIPSRRNRDTMLHYARHIRRLAGDKFLSAGKFTSEERTSSDGTRIFEVLDSNGKRYGKAFAANNREESVSLAGNLNDQLIDAGLAKTINTAIEESGLDLSPEERNTMFAYGWKVLHPDQNVYTSAELNQAGGTTAVDGFDEQIPNSELGGIAPSKLTMAQRINRKKMAKGEAPTNTFTILEAKSVLGDKLGNLRTGEIETETYQAKKTVERGKDKFAVISSSGEVITGRATGIKKKKKDGVEYEVRPFKSVQDANAFAQRRNKDRNITSVDESVFANKKVRLAELNRLLESKNIVTELGSPEFRTLIEAFTGVKASGSKRIKDLTNAEMKILYQKIRSMPQFAEPTSLINFIAKKKPVQQEVLTEAEQQRRMPALTEEALSQESQERAAEKERLAEEVAKLEAIQKKLDEAMDKAGLSDIKANIHKALQNVLRNAEGELVFGIRERREGERDVQSFGGSSRLVVEESLDADALYSNALGEIFLGLDKIDPNLTPEQQVDAALELLSHEQVHAMRAMNLFTDKEWKLLSEATNNTKSEESAEETFLQVAARNYEGLNLTDEAIIEEAVAELVRVSKRNPSIISGKPKNLLSRISELLSRLKGFLAGTEYATFDGLIRDIESGVVGKRERGVRLEGILEGVTTAAPTTERMPDFIPEMLAPEDPSPALQDKLSRSANLIDYIKENPEGFTVDAVTFETPSGVAVAPIKALEVKVAIEDITEDLIDKTVDNYKKLADKLDKDVYIGGWLNSEDGLYYLDASITTETREEALYVADAGEQEAVFDLNTFEEIRTDEGIRQLKESGTYDSEAADSARRNKEKLDRIFVETRDTGQAPEVRERPDGTVVGGDPDIQKATRDQGAIQKSVDKNEQDAVDTPAAFVPRFSFAADPEAQYIAQNPEEGLTPSINLTNKFSRRNAPELAPEAQSVVSRVSSEPETDATPGETYLEAASSFKGEISQHLTRLKMNAINNWARLEQYSRDEQFKENLADTSAISAALFSDRSMGLVAAALKSGVIVYENGLTKVVDFVHINKSGKLKKYRGLVDVMAPLYSNNYDISLEELAQAYAIAKRAERLRARGLPVPTEAGDLAVLEKEIAKFKNDDGVSIIEEWYDTWQAYNNKTVDFMKATGIVDEALAESWLEMSDYIPFYRQAEGAEGESIDLGKHVPKMFKGSMTSAVKLQRMKGSEKAVNVPMLDAITRNLSMAIDAGMKNVAQQRIVRDMVLAGAAEKATVAQQKNKAQHYVVSFKVEGKEQHYAIKDPLIYESMQSIESPGMMTSIVGTPSRWLRELITRDPGFMFANMMRDTLSAYVTSGSDFTPIVDTLKNISFNFEQLERFGVVGGYDFSKDPDDMVEAFTGYSRERGVDVDGGGSSVNMFMKLWNWAGNATTASDAATRKAVYNDVLARTGNEAEAAFQALEVINFSRRGRNPAVRLLTTAIPFLNARFQGVDVLYRGFMGYYSANKERTRGEAARTAMMRGSLLMATTVAYWLMFSDDDEYKKATNEQRDLNWILSLPKSLGVDVPLRIPVPFEVGLFFKTIPERILDTYGVAEVFGKEGQTSKRELAESILRGVGETLAVNPLGAQIVAPLIEASLNKNFYTGRDIVPFYLSQNQSQGLISRASNTEISKLIGEAVNISPMKLDHVLYGYTGTLGAYLIDAVDQFVLKNPIFTGDKRTSAPTKDFTQLPIIKRFFLNKFSSGDVQDFYELRKEISHISGDLKRLADEDRMDEYEAVFRARGHLLGMKDAVNYTSRLLSDLRKQRQIVERSTLSPEQKKDMIDEIQKEIEAAVKFAPLLKREASLPARRSIGL